MFCGSVAWSDLSNPIKKAKAERTRNYELRNLSRANRVNEKHLSKPQIQHILSNCQLIHLNF